MSLRGNIPFSWPSTACPSIRMSSGIRSLPSCAVLSARVGATARCRMPVHTTRRSLRVDRARRPLLPGGRQGDRRGCPDSQGTCNTVTIRPGTNWRDRHGESGHRAAREHQLFRLEKTMMNRIRPTQKRDSFGESERAMSNASASCEIVRPTLHHFGLTTANLVAMLDWYGNALGRRPTTRRPGHWGERPLGGAGRLGQQRRGQPPYCDRGTSRPGGRPRTHPPPAAPACRIRYPSVDDLLATNARLKGLGIEPVLTADHGATTAFYYEDPDHNSIELLADNFGDWKNQPSSCALRQRLRPTRWAFTLIPTR